MYCYKKGGIILNNNLKAIMSQKMKEVLKNSEVPKDKLADKLYNYPIGGISKSSINRYLSPNESTFPRADFLKAFCDCFKVSADYVLGMDSAVYTPEITPDLVLNNLLVLMKQIDFNIDFTNNASKVTLTTDNPGVINFLFAIRNKDSKDDINGNFISQIVKDCVIINKKIYSEEDLKKLYLEYHFNVANEYMSEAYDALYEFREKVKNDDAELKDMFLDNWENMTKEQRIACIKEICEPNKS